MDDENFIEQYMETVDDVVVVETMESDMPTWQAINRLANLMHISVAESAL